MSSQDHTYLCKALLAHLNQAVAQTQRRVLLSDYRQTIMHNTKSFYQYFTPADRMGMYKNYYE